jgi:hypothetical protein
MLSSRISYSGAKAQSLCSFRTPQELEAPAGFRLAVSDRGFKVRVRWTYPQETATLSPIAHY